MRKHDVRSQVDSSISTEYIQNKVNIYSTLYIKKALDESGLSKEDKLNIINKIIENIKNNA